MEIFEYLDEEGRFVDKKLSALVSGFANSSREQVFDEVKFLCDAVAGYLNKQNDLLFKEIEDILESDKEATSEHVANMQVLRGEVENLTMVHVDEPGYEKYLESLLDRLRACEKSFSKLSSYLKEKLPGDRLATINDELEKVIHSPVELNQMPAQK